MIIFITVTVYHKFLSITEKIFRQLLDLPLSWILSRFNLLSFGLCSIQYLQYVHINQLNVPEFFNLHQLPPPPDCEFNCGAWLAKWTDGDPLSPVQKKETNKQTKQKKIKFLVEIFQYFNTYRKSSVGLDMFRAGGIGIVGVATRQRLDGSGPNPSGARFYVPVKTGPEAPQSALKWVPALFPWGKAAGSWL